MTRRKHKSAAMWIMELAASFDYYGDTDDYNDIKEKAK